MNRPRVHVMRWIAAAIVVLPTAVVGQTVRVGVSVTPDTVRVGDPFTILVAVRVPRGATVDFPADPDTTGPIQSLAPHTVANGPRSDADSVEHQATYRVAAWDVGSFDALVGEVLVRHGADERHAIVPRMRVFVQSVLPADSAERVPKPARDLILQRHIPWWWWAVLAAAIALGWLLWWWWHRRARTVLDAGVDPYAWAVAEFARIDALNLVAAGERGRHVALMVDVLRAYLAHRYSSAPLSTTSGELLSAMRRESGLPNDRLVRLLNESDLIKFARRPVSEDQAKQLAVEAQALVHLDHEQALAAAAAAASAATAPRRAAA